jgi:hypothetical protein
MPTRLQIKVLHWMIANGGELFISTGHKRVRFDYTDGFGKQGELFCKGNVNLLDGLTANKYIESMFPITSVDTVVAVDINGVKTTRPGRDLALAQRVLRLRYKITSAGIQVAKRYKPRKTVGVKAQQEVAP